MAAPHHTPHRTTRPIESLVVVATHCIVTRGLLTLTLSLPLGLVHQNLRRLWVAFIALILARDIQPLFIEQGLGEGVPIRALVLELPLKGALGIVGG